MKKPLTDIIPALEAALELECFTPSSTPAIVTDEHVTVESVEGPGPGAFGASAANARYLFQTNQIVVRTPDLISIRQMDDTP